MMQSITWIVREKHWGFPVERFTKYEKSDEPWCRYFGIGKEAEIDVKRTVVDATIVSCKPGEITFQGFEYTNKAAAMRTESSKEPE